jgi:hypothetical protein
VVFGIAISCTHSILSKHNPPKEDEFYFDQNNFSYIRLYPNKNAGVIDEYRRWITTTDSSPFNFYKKHILKTSKFNPNFDKDEDEKIKKPKMIKKPRLSFPTNTPMIGKSLIVAVTVYIDTTGYVEFAHLYDIYRKEENVVRVEPFSNLKDETPWRNNIIYEHDIEFIKLSLKSTISSRFRPATQNGKKVKVKMNMPFSYKI